MSNVSRRSPVEQVCSLLSSRHYSLRTEEAYAGWIQGVRYLVNIKFTHLPQDRSLISLCWILISLLKRFILFHHKRHPEEMGEKTGSGIFESVSGEGKGGGLHAESGLMCHFVSV